jgi:hypothetical protein
VKDWLLGHLHGDGGGGGGAEDPCEHDGIPGSCDQVYSMLPPPEKKSSNAPLIVGGIAAGVLLLALAKPAPRRRAKH